MVTPSKPTPATEPVPGPEAMTLKPARHKPPLSMAQQRFLLCLLILVALLGTLYVVATCVKDKGMQTAILAIVGTALVGPLRDAFRHYFPGGQADQPSLPSK